MATFTDEDLIRARREGFKKAISMVEQFLKRMPLEIAGVDWVKYWNGVGLPTWWDCRAQDEDIAKIFPIVRPRTVVIASKHGQTYEFRADRDKLEYREVVPSDIEYFEPRSMWKPVTILPCEPTPKQIVTLADLIKNPTENV